MSFFRSGGPLASAIGVALLILSLQVLSALIPPLGDAIRNLPVVPVALVAVTALIGIQLIRSR